MMVKKVEFKDPEAEEAVPDNGASAPEAHKLVRIIVHTSHSGDETPVQFRNPLYPEWGPLRLYLPRNEEVVVDSRILPRLDGKHSKRMKVDADGRPVRDPKTGDVVKIKKLRFPYTIVGDA